MSGPFYQKSWAQRYDQLGDEAEAVFDAVLPIGKADRYGLRRPEIDIRKLDPFHRYTPDRITQGGPPVEVMGLGRDGILKIKEDKVAALADWNRHGMVYLFVWNSHRKEWLLAPYASVRSLCQRIAKRGEMGTFDGTKPFYPIPWMELTHVSGVIRGEYQP